MPSCIYNKFMPIESIISNFSENISLFGEVYSRLFLIPLPLTLLKKSRELSSFLIVFLKYIPFYKHQIKTLNYLQFFGLLKLLQRLKSVLGMCWMVKE